MAESNEKPTHSPGPWRTYASDMANTVYGPPTLSGDPPQFKVRGDARLIASAPTLLRQRDELLALVHRYRDARPGKALPDADAAEVIARIEAEIAQERAQPGGEVDRG